MKDKKDNLEKFSKRIEEELESTKIKTLFQKKIIDNVNIAFKKLIPQWLILSLISFTVYNKDILFNKETFGVKDFLSQFFLLIFLIVLTYSISVIVSISKLKEIEEDDFDIMLFNKISNIAFIVLLLDLLIFGKLMFWGEW